MPEVVGKRDGSLAEPAGTAANEDAGKPRREPLTRDRIIRAALRIMDEEGLEAVTMRRIGRELGVEAMSLYNHVKDKEDILDGITEMVMGEFEFPEDAGHWIEVARAGARAWRRMLKSHPNVMTLLSERKHPMTSIEALRPMEFAFDVLRRSGLSEQETVQAFRSFGGYIFGFVMMEVGNLVAGVGGGIDAVDPAALAAMLPADRLPRFLELLPELVNCDIEADFEFGLDLLLAGLEARLGP